MKRHINDVSWAHDQFDPIPWMVIGVFPVENDEPTQWNYFNYTVGATQEWDLWCPAQSIEGRGAGNELIGMMLNRLTVGLLLGEVWFGDDVVVPLGVAGGDDIDCVFWIGWPRNNNPTSRMQTYRSSAPSIVPVLWTSGLGWK